MNRLWRLVIVVALLPLACARAQDTSKNDETITAYMQLFDSAQGSKDPEYVKSVIKTMREKYMNTTPKILGIYYNMALLYRRIGLYDDAVKVMKEDKGPSGGFYLATLFIRIGRAEDARVILQGFQTDLRTRLANDKLEINARSSIVETLFVLAVFLDEDADRLANDIVDKGWLPKDAVDEIKARNQVSKTKVLADTWPD